MIKNKDVYAQEYVHAEIVYVDVHKLTYTYAIINYASGDL